LKAFRLYSGSVGQQFPDGDGQPELIVRPNRRLGASGFSEPNPATRAKAGA
jgi:hypothetical protein